MLCYLLTETIAQTAVSECNTNIAQYRIPIIYFTNNFVHKNRDSKHIIDGAFIHNIVRYRSFFTVMFIFFSYNLLINNNS